MDNTRKVKKKKGGGQGEEANNLQQFMLGELFPSEVSTTLGQLYYNWV